MNTSNSYINLVKGPTGYSSIIVKGDDGIERVLHSLYQPEKEAKCIVSSCGFKDDGIIVILGVGFGYLVKEFKKQYPNSKIVAVERHPEIYAIAKDYLQKNGLDKEHVLLLSGKPEDILSTISRIQIENGMPPLYLYVHPPSIYSFKNSYQPLINALKDTISFKVWERIRYNKFKKEDLTVLFINFGYFLNLEIELSFKQTGHRLIRIQGTKNDSLSNVIKNILKAIIEYRPDFVFTVNHLGFDEEGILADLLNSIEMPVAVWYVDSPDIIVSPYSRNVKDNKVIFLWDRSYIKSMKNLGFKHVFYLPLATEPEIFKPLKGHHLNRYRCRVSFVGNSMVDAYRKQLKKIPLDYHGLVEKLASELAEKRVTFQQLIDNQPEKVRENLNNLPEKYRREIEATVYWKATLLHRSRTISMLEEFNPVVYGDDGWRSLLGNSFTVKSRVDYYNELPLVYNASEVNFNTTSLQMPEAVNQRVFDVPACGGFLLTDYQEALEELFDIKNEMVVYSSIEEIPDIMRFYLANPELRKKKALAAMKRVLKEHTYLNRIKFIIDTMRKLFK